MCRNPLLCAVPPYVLHEVAARGTERQRKWALKTLSADTTIRHARAINTKARGRKGPREGYDALAAAAKAKRNRIIWDARHSYAVSGLKRVRDEDDPPVKDKAVNEAFDGLGETWDFWLRAFSRDSIDDENMPMRGIVHYGDEYPNAFWDGRRMVFGDGDGEIFTRFTKSLDVIGHELGHGVIEDEAALEYHAQSEPSEHQERFRKELETKIFAREDAHVQLGDRPIRLDRFQEAEGFAQLSECAEDLALYTHMVRSELGFSHEPPHPVTLAVLTRDLSAGNVATRLTGTPGVLRLDAETLSNLGRIDARMANAQRHREFVVTHVQSQQAIGTRGPARLWGGPFAFAGSRRTVSSGANRRPRRVPALR